MRIKRDPASGAAGLFIIGALFGMLLLEGVSAIAPSQEAEPGEQPVMETPQALVEAQTQREIQLLENASVEWTARFSRCGHELTQSRGDILTGMTKRELIKAYPTYSVELFDEGHVRMVRAVTDYCPAHYVLYLDGDVLIVTHTDELTLERRELMRIDPAALGVDVTPALDEATRESLGAGVPFDALDEINEYLEGAE